jgi:hypothetical protein
VIIADEEISEISFPTSKTDCVVLKAFYQNQLEMQIKVKNYL